MVLCTYDKKCELKRTENNETMKQNYEAFKICKALEQIQPYPNCTISFCGSNNFFLFTSCKIMYVRYLREVFFFEKKLYQKLGDFLKNIEELVEFTLEKSFKFISQFLGSKFDKICPKNSFVM